MADFLSDEKIEAIAGQLSVKEITLTAVAYMDIEYHEIESLKTIWWKAADADNLKKSIVGRWRNNTKATVQMLADILKTTGIIQKRKIKEVLGGEENHFIGKKPSVNPDLEEWEMARVALTFSENVIEKMARKYDMLTDDQINKIRSKNIGDASYQTFEILITWSRKQKSNRQKLMELLDKEPDVDSQLARKLLGDSLDSRDCGDGDQKAPLKNDEPVYDMDPEHPGYVLIFNNKTFPISGKHRHGTDEDAQRLTDEFSQRGFKVVEEKDLLVKDMTTKIKAFVVKDRLKSSEDQEEFLKNIKLEEQEKQKKEEYLVKLEKDAVVGGWDTFREKQILIEMTRKEIGEFRLGEDDIKKIDDPKTKAEMDEFKKATKIGAKEKKNIEDFLKKMEDKELEKASSSVVVFMSHGGNGYIKDKNGGKADIDNLINEFISDNCKALAGKPKAFLIQACRGGRKDVQIDDEAAIEPEIDYPIKDGQAIPNCADMIIGYSTSAGQVSFRYPKSDRYPEVGAAFIEELCDVLNKCGNNMDVLAMTTKINNQVAERFHGSENAKQMSEFRHSLRKRWLLPNKQTE